MQLLLTGSSFCSGIPRQHVTLSIMKGNSYGVTAAMLGRMPENCLTNFSERVCK